ncbi:MAG: alkyl sulfatase dimerization domain-containing protein [Byssovorax sp.]
MGKLRDLSERILAGSLDVREHNPIAPMLCLEEVAPGAAFVSSFANVTAIDTSEGLLLIDTGSFFLAAASKAMIQGYSKKRLHTALFTHGHVDHVFGVDLWEAEGGKAHVLAHEAVPRRFARYRLTRGYNSCINSRQFQSQTDFPVDFREPDQTFADPLTIDVGGERVEIHPAMGETDDHAWAYLPQKKLLCTGDLFIWATPNAGNPQKVQRYPRAWAEALRAMSTLGAEVLCPGHGWPIFGGEAVRRALVETAELLESLVSQTLALMNEGARLDRVLGEVRAPAHLLERPYLRPVYDEPEFVVRNIWRQYGGWHDGNPAHLKPGSEQRLAEEVAALAGGARKLADRAVVLSSQGDHAPACHLIEMASLAAPADSGIWKTRTEIYRARAEVETSLMARGIYSSAARGRRGRWAEPQCDARSLSASRCSLTDHQQPRRGTPWPTPVTTTRQPARAQPISTLLPPTPPRRDARSPMSRPRSRPRSARSPSLPTTRPPGRPP